MRVCQIHLGTAFGGAERLFVDLSVELMASGVDVLAICNPDTPTSKEVARAGIPWVPVAERSSSDAAAARRIGDAVRDHGCDLVHAHLSRATRLAAKARVGVPLVASIHNYGSWKYYAGASAYMPVTGHGARYVRSHGVPEDRIWTIANFTRLPPRQEERPPPMAPYHLLAYGRFVVEKGFQDLIQACRILEDSGIDFRARIAGDGEYADALHSQLDACGLRGRIDLGGWIDDVVPQLDGADLFVLPSRSEPFGIVLLEAMARRVPIVATRAEGPTEFLTDEEVRFSDVADPEDLAAAIRATLNEPDESARRAHNAFDLYGRHYTPTVVRDTVIACYRALTNGYVVV